MTIINVFDENFNLIGVVDSYISIIWRPAYYDIGDFEIYLGASTKILELLKVGRIVVRSTDINTDGSGNVSYKNSMIIKNIDLLTSAENGDFLSVTGRELKYLLHQRIIWNQTNLAGNVENALRRLVSENAISPTDNKRKIPNLVLGATAGISGNVEKQLTGDILSEAISELCMTYGLGWDIFGYNHSYVFIIYKGVNRSYSQNEVPYVVFSDTFENLYNTEYQINTEEYANVALIAGEGEGIERTKTTLNNELSGLERIEIYVDARDLSSNKDSEEEIPQAEYLRLLGERGAEKLAELATTEGFSGEVMSAGSYVYDVDYGLGDTVTVINNYGIQKDVIVLSAIESEDEDGIKLIPQFNV